MKNKKRKIYNKEILEDLTNNMNFLLPYLKVLKMDENEKKDAKKAVKILKKYKRKLKNEIKGE
ncbi:MAG: hypothetical protein PHF63_00915 [Herbinix sp.]|nr:hypothetical protein [Herbinix sp.]